MPPKKSNDTGADLNSVVGFDGRETKMLAAAFLSSTTPDKFDYDLFASLTGYTAGSLKKMWPPVKRKAIEAHPSFAIFLGTSASNAEETKAHVDKKRKARSDGDIEADKDVNAEQVQYDDNPDGKKKAPVKGRGRVKKAKVDSDVEANLNGDKHGNNNSGEALRKKAHTKGGRAKKARPEKAEAEVKKEAAVDDFSEGEGKEAQSAADDEQI